MDNTLDQQEMSGQHQLSTTAIEHMRRASRWMKFMAIVGFVFSALLILAAILMIVQETIFGAGLLIIYLVFGLVGFFMSLFWFQSASYMRRFADGADHSDGDNAFIKLNTFSTFAGVITIIYLAFIIVIIATGSFANLLLGGI